MRWRGKVSIGLLKGSRIDVRMIMLRMSLCWCWLFERISDSSMAQRHWAHPSIAATPNSSLRYWWLQSEHNRVSWPETPQLSFQSEYHPPHSQTSPVDQRISDWSEPQTYQQTQATWPTWRIIKSHCSPRLRNCRFRCWASSRSWVIGTGSKGPGWTRLGLWGRGRISWVGV